uniref:Uncharacterized protein n=1 Tax=Panagrolaimus sp. PS1159 TaxID=55785 RepID=A0AC35F378_9BILA
MKLVIEFTIDYHDHPEVYDVKTSQTVAPEKNAAVVPTVKQQCAKIQYVAEHFIKMKNGSINIKTSKKGDEKRTKGVMN